MHFFDGVESDHVMFQSAPGTCAGRCRNAKNRSSCRRVSIRARHVCRAMPARSVVLGVCDFVSIRARHVCRAMHSSDVPSITSISFQSAPGTCAGRCAVGNAHRRCRLWFQSAPGTCAGRCPKQEYNGDILLWFQSAPGTCAGRCCPQQVPPSR